MLPLTLLPSASSVRADEPDYFAETSFGVYQPLIRRFFFQQGGVATFGNPLSREFRFRGRAVQVFQQAVLATAPDRSVAPTLCSASTTCPLIVGPSAPLTCRTPT